PRRTRRPPRTERRAELSVVTRASFGPRRSEAWVDRLLDADPVRSFAVDLPLGDLLERDRQGLVPQPGLDQGRHELGAALAQLVVIGVDLAGALGRQRHEGVLRV